MANNLKKIVFLLLAFGFPFLLLNCKDVKADTIVASGNCGDDGYTGTNTLTAPAWGDNATWTLDSKGVLTISGTGGVHSTSGMWSYNNGPENHDCPWYEYTDSIKKIIINEGISSLSEQCFYGCTNAQSVSLPSTLTSLPRCAFQACFSLTLHQSDLQYIRMIGSNAFWGCTVYCDYNSDLYNFCRTQENVTAIYPSIKDATITFSSQAYTADKIPKTPEAIVNYNGNILVNGTDYVVTYENNTDAGTATAIITGKGKYGDSVRKEFTITGISMENVDISLKKTIYTYDGSAKTPTINASYNGTKLVNGVDYTLSYKDNQDEGTAQVIVTGKGMFTDAASLSFVILPYNPGMDSVYGEGTLIDGNFVYGITDDEKNEVELCCPAKMNLKKIQIPAKITDADGKVYTVTSIGQKAFYKNTKLSNVIIGNNVKSIEDYAFYGCKNITNIVFGKNVEIIGNSSFRKCTKLISITLPKSLDELGKNAFYGCSKLKSIILNANTVVDINANAIKNVSKKVVIKVPKKLVKNYTKEFTTKTGFKKTMKIKRK